MFRKVTEKRIEMGVDKVSYIIDVGGISMNNYDPKMFWSHHLYYDVHQIYEPVIDEILVVNAGWGFKSIWYVINKLIPTPITRKVIY